MKYITLSICWLAVLQATAQVKNGADRLEELFPLLENNLPCTERTPSGYFV